MRRSPQAVRRSSARRAPSLAHVAIIGAVLIASGLVATAMWQTGALPDATARGPAMQATLDQPAGPDRADGAAEPTAIPPPINAQAPGADAGWTRVPKPVMPTGPRRVGIQAGHWLTEEAPPELGRILTQTGASWRGVNERDMNLEIAEKVAAILREKGIVVDVLPTTVPPGYLADAFVSLHGDSDGAGVKSGFKLAHSSRRTPHEDTLQRILTEEYGAATQLPYDAAGVSGNMRGYYAHSWTRVRYSTSPFTPSVILEMGFVSNDHDRHLMMNEQDRLAVGIANAILRFLEATPRDELFGKDLLVPPFRARVSPSPSPGT